MDKLLERIVEAANNLAKAKELRCTCESIVLQINGCSCLRDVEVSKFEKELADAIREAQEAVNK
jgi:hypothetical protein